MKRFVFVITIFAFLTSSWANVVHAEIIDATCSHQASKEQPIDDPPCVDGEQDQEQSDFAQCLDCCCHHVHVMAKKLSNTSVFPNFKAVHLMAPQGAPKSKTHSPLYKPPIA